MNLIERLGRLRLVPVVSLPSVDAGLRLAELLLECSLPVIEVTFRTKYAAGAIERITREYPDVMLIAGTVLGPDHVDRARASGARAIVSPGFTTQLADYCRSKSVDFFPGVCTPSEVQLARESGLNYLKFFPASLSGGPAMLSLFKALYPDTRFMPTGGINLENLRDYLALDNVLCCGGTWLSPEQLMADGEWQEIRNRVSGAVELLSTS